VDQDELRRRYALRLAALDPLLPAPRPLSGVLLRTGSGAAAAMVHSVEPESFAALWGPLTRHWLDLRLADADLGPLLDRWEERLRATAVPDNSEVVAVVPWPSRDVEPVRELVLRGFAPLSVLAVRRRGALAIPAPAVLIRPVTAADLRVCVDLYAMVVCYDARFGVVNARPSVRERAREVLVELIERDHECAWVALRDGEPVGLITIDFPEYADKWVTGLTSAVPAAYLGVLGVAEGLRGGGIGTALAAHGHRVLDEAEVAVTLLYHALPNPRSTPFWYAQGYRPLWTIWQRSPALLS
jgi:hypothetical protein